ncbi:MAG: hypothetical protein PHE24_03280 [Patescibacteria group bacterium]|nr:hypothetical protein [Patescibacteria group bacterium]
MNKKTISKFFVLGLGIFVLAGCSVYPFSTPNLPRVAPVPVQQAPEVTPKATSTGEQAVTSTKIDTSGWEVFSDPVLNYQFKYPANFFPGDGKPVIKLFSCNADQFAQTCPPVAIDGAANIDDLIKNGMVKIGRQDIGGERFCTQTWSEGAAGSSFTTYAYTNVNNGSCVAVEMTIQYVRCENYDAGPNRDACLNKNNVVAPATLEAILASFNFYYAVSSSSVSSGQVLRELQLGKDYQITTPAGYFDEGPRAFEVTCNMAKECPCIYNPSDSIYNHISQDKRTFCQFVPPARKGNFCVQEFSGAAAGTIYATYFYTTAIPGSADRCALLQFTKHFTSDCGVVSGKGAEEFTAQCEKEGADSPGIINKVVESFKMVQ